MIWTPRHDATEWMTGNEINAGQRWKKKMVLERKEREN